MISELRTQELVKQGVLERVMLCVPAYRVVKSHRDVNPVLNIHFDCDTCHKTFDEWIKLVREGSKVCGFCETTQKHGIIVAIAQSEIQELIEKLNLGEISLEAFKKLLEKLAGKVEEVVDKI